MDRYTIIKMLCAYQPTQEEIVFKEKIIDFLSNNEDCFKRSLEIGHVTASAWVLNKNKEKALLMHHAKLNLWVQLGGHCDGNPDVLSVAIKEAQEESGIQHITLVNKEIFDIDIHHIPANRYEMAHYHYDIRFLVQVMSDEQGIRNHESRALKWIGKNYAELPTNQRSVVRMFEKWVNNFS